MSDVKTSINKVQVVGTLLEMNLMEETKEVTLKGANGVEKKVTCRSIGKKEFKNPTFLVEVEKKDEDGNVVSTSNVGIDFYSIAEKKLDEHGNIVDNPRFKSMETVFETYLPKVNCKSDEKPTRVKIDGSLRENGYVDKNTYEFTLNQTNQKEIGVILTGLADTLHKLKITVLEGTLSVDSLLVSRSNFLGCL